MKYNIVSKPTTDELTNKVNCYLAEGWELHGSMTFVLSGKEVLFYQPMIKENRH